MSTDTLSQNDIDRLLGGHGGGSRATQNGVPGVDVQLHDWRRSHRVSKDRLRSLEAMYERLVKGLESWLTSRVRGQLELKLQSIEQFTFGEFALSLPLPCSSFLVDIVGTGQQGVIDVGPEFSTFLIDRLFGGEGAGDVLTRTLTPLERLAVKGVTDRIASALQEIWRDKVPMELSVTGFESSPEMLAAVDRDDPVLVANVEFLSGNVSSLLLICLPLSALEPFFTSDGAKRAVPASSSDAERDANRQRSEAALRATKVPLTARLPDFRLSMRDLAQFEVGSVIPTGLSKDARVIVRAGTQERFIGHAGRVSGNIAVRILDAVPSASSSPDTRTSA